MREAARNTKPVQALAPALRAGTATGAAIDRLGFEELSFLVSAGAWTDGQHTLGVEESDDGTNWAAVPAASLTAPMPILANNVGTIQPNSAAPLIGYMGDARYVRVRSTVSASPATGAVIGVTALLGRAQNRPSGTGLK